MALIGLIQAELLIVTQALNGDDHGKAIEALKRLEGLTHDLSFADLPLEALRHGFIVRMLHYKLLRESSQELENKIKVLLGSNNSSV